MNKNKTEIMVKTQAEGQIKRIIICSLYSLTDTV